LDWQQQQQQRTNPGPLTQKQQLALHVGAWWLMGFRKLSSENQAVGLSAATLHRQASCRQPHHLGSALTFGNPTGWLQINAQAEP